MDKIVVGASRTYFQLPSNLRCMKYIITHIALAQATANTRTIVTGFGICNTSKITDNAVHPQSTKKMAR